jgi:putative phosphoribosyl transferase
MRIDLTPRHTPRTRVVHIAVEHGSLVAELAIPREPMGIVVFARTNAAGRQTRYDRDLSKSLQAFGFATVLLDLLTPADELVDAATCAMRTDVALLARRLIEVIDWFDVDAEVAHLDVGLVAEGAGAAAAFVAACVRPQRVAAIVSYADRLDLAAPVLDRVQAPSLLIVAGNNDDALRSNDRAFRKLECTKELVRIGQNQFTMPAALDDEVSRLAREWLVRAMTPVFADASDNSSWKAS